MACKRRSAFQTGGGVVNEFPLSQPSGANPTLHKCQTGGGVSGNWLFWEADHQRGIISK